MGYLDGDGNWASEPGDAYDHLVELSKPTTQQIMEAWAPYAERLGISPLEVWGLTHHGQSPHVWALALPDHAIDQYIASGFDLVSLHIWQDGELIGPGAISLANVRNSTCMARQPNDLSRPGVLGRRPVPASRRSFSGALPDDPR